MDSTDFSPPNKKRREEESVSTDKKGQEFYQKKKKGQELVSMAVATDEKEGEELASIARTTGKKIETIIYKRGSLKVLDQRELPSKYQYLDIKEPKDARNAIKDMAVRGASAIAMVATLSLAVDVYNLTFKFSDIMAAAFLERNLDILLSSRPSIANLSNAAIQLKVIASNAVTEGNVFKAYIEAAETMARKEFESIRKIGSNGAEFFLKKILNKKISVLTDCNTGNLATGDYGSACGVIHDLFAKEMLDMVYFTETRPFNEGSRLTALELLNQEISATLVADSAVGLLMAEGSVNVVIVGANCIASNGDTASTIGTSVLAMCAMCHKIPFYVAAPLASIDTSLSTGEKIKIEERSGKELLLPWGDLMDEKSAASKGLHVRNPVSDVTPFNLIDGFITDKGVIEKNKGGFDLKDFIEKK